MKQEANKLFQHALPRMNYHIAIAVGISSSRYGSNNDRLRGSGQGNSVSGVIYQDTLCLIFKYLE